MNRPDQPLTSATTPPPSAPADSAPPRSAPLPSAPPPSASAAAAFPPTFLTAENRRLAAAPASLLMPVARILRDLQLWRSWSLIFLLGSLAGWACLRPVGRGQLPADATLITLLAAVAIAAAAAAWIAGRSYRNPYRLALQVERLYPDLQQRLLTALDLTAAADGNRAAPLRYLDRRVIEETAQHAQTHRWADVVPPEKLFYSRLTGLATAAVMLATVAALAYGGGQIEPPANIATAIDLPLVGSFQVQPGNTEVERGSNLIVSARLIGSSLDLQDATVVVSDGQSPPQRYPLQRTLADESLSALLPNLQQSADYWIEAGGLHSEAYRVEVYQLPELQRADALLVYPEYTQLPDKRIDDTLRVSMVQGTRLNWQLNVSKPLRSAALVTATGPPLPLQPAADNPLRFEIELQPSESQEWQLELVDRDGRENRFPPTLVARVLPNTPPDLKLLAGGDAEVSPLEEFPLAVTVKDDFGVARLGLTYQIAGQPAQQIVLAQAVAAGQSQRADFQLDFESLAAQPDQLLTYYFWAEDQDADGQPRLSQGDLYFLEVRPFEEIYRENQSGSNPAQQQQPTPSGGQNGQQAEQLAEQQKLIINATWKIIRQEIGSQRSDTFSDDLNQVTASQNDARQQLLTLQEQLNDQRSVDFAAAADDSMQQAINHLQQAASDDDPQPLNEAVAAQQAAYQALLGLRAREFQVSRSQPAASSGGAGGAQQRRQQQLNELQLQNDINRYETQSQAQDRSQSQEPSAQREVSERLRELAQRQEDINQQIAELQAAVELAQSEQERDEARRQLQRLRDQQQQLLRDTDELTQRIDELQRSEQGAESESLQQAGEQLETTRENVRRTAESLQQEDPSAALASGTRAERQLDETRQQLRENSADSLRQAVQQLRSDARDLDQTQQELNEQIRSADAPNRSADAVPGLRPAAEESDLSQLAQQQRQRLQQLMDGVEQLVQEAESTEPLLAQKLYDTYRHTQQQRLDNQLETTEVLLRRGLQPQAEQMGQQAAEATAELRQRLEQAAESVLGDETQSLARALSELDRLQQQLDDEITEQRGDQRPAGQPDDGRPGQPSPGQQPSGGQTPPEQPASPQQQAGSGQPNAEQTSNDQPSNDQPGNDQPGGSQPSNDQPGGSQPSENAAPQPGLLDRLAPSQLAGQESAAGAGGQPSGAARPLTGNGFRQWSDSLRDVESLLDQPQLRSEAIRIRDRAREIRSEVRRHSEPPQWELVDELIAQPLRNLRQQVSQELLRRSADRHTLVPLDRDPVPDRYSSAVQQYYESLGSGQ